MIGRSEPNGISLRLAGLVLCALAVVAGNALTGAVDAHPGEQASALACLLAAIAFLAGSGGCALVVLGRHLVDEVAVSSPWMRSRAAQPPMARFAPHRPEVERRPVLANA